MSQTLCIPLLNDHHSHPLFYSAFQAGVNLQPIHDQETANRLVRETFESGDADLVLAHGWRSNRFAWSPQDLEGLPPTAIFNVSLHSLLINEQGTRILRQNYGDTVDRLFDRQWYESNLRVVLNWFANLNASVNLLQQFYDGLLQQGVWSAEELLLVDENEIQLFDQAGLQDRTKFWAAPDTYSSLGPESQARVAGLKLFTDGAIGSRTAALNRPYRDDAENRGMLIYSDRQLTETVSQCLASGKSLAIHAIGDRAIEQSIMTLEGLKSEIDQAPQIRLEHVQLIDLEQAKRAKDLGLVLSMQPNFSSDSTAYADRLSPDYCRANNPFRMLIDQAGFECGKDLILGSDGMPHGISTALRESLFPSVENQKMSLEEFERGYCAANQTTGSIDLSISETDIRFTVQSPQTAPRSARLGNL